MIKKGARRKVQCSKCKVEEKTVYPAPYTYT
jgi:hypothetical protein